MITLESLEPHIAEAKQIFDAKLPPSKAGYFYAKLQSTFTMKSKDKLTLGREELITALSAELYLAECSSCCEQKDAPIVVDVIKQFAHKIGVSEEVEKMSADKKSRFTEDTIRIAKNISQKIWLMHEKNKALHEKETAKYTHDISQIFAYVDGILNFKNERPNFDLIGTLAEGMLGIDPGKTEHADIGLGMDLLAKEYGIENQVYEKYRELAKARSEKEK